MCKWVCDFYSSTIGKKAIVAVTGLMMIGWLAGHVLGNLQIFAGRGDTPDTTKINEYATWLHQNVAMLWGVRIAMFSAIALHISAVVQLTLLNKAARPQAYDIQKPLKSSLASRIMLIGGTFILGYLIYHILHFTLGAVHKDLFTPNDVYENVMRSFKSPFIVGIYLIAQACLYLHLSHGFQSVFRTLGLSHGRYLCMIQALGYAVSALIVLGFSAIPIAVIFGFIS